MTELRAFWPGLIDGGHALLDFMAAGGPEMWVLAVLCVVYWTLVFERLWFMRRVFPQWAEARRRDWGEISQAPGTWQRAVRRAWLAQAQQKLAGPLRVGKVLVALYPLLGLLGTVGGMIAVFDVLALSGAGNPRGMAAGVWRATLPTMAGMVLAITGLFSLAQLERIARQILEQLADQLRHD
ncbi:MotA/TolQ/ExbB proton channel family protein [Azotobacter beijerinckii]|uniref:Biopolymer transport protein ExbB n=1 Tax=Azotobacter beijerinckii TaxID=170623 RepID=A0A1I3ZB08_9GAMM|nr:MotA/TolQ/ExbB proton channel family protein [Azotobacter beijerinckii]SFA81014.1 biopolymer transport protein ExbB [Azotobacter beijerinckii]SFK41358.1 biopolymer transport protein ExbB [Azotobacter beijerinckii]